MAKVYDLPLDAEWTDLDPADWRDLPEPDDGDLDNDEDEPCPEWVSALLGFDPDDEDWDEEATDNAFCPTGKGGGIKNTCSSRSPLNSSQWKERLDRMKGRITEARARLAQAVQDKSKKRIQRGKRRLKNLYQTLGKMARRYDDQQTGSGGFTTELPSHGGYISKFLFGGTANQLYTEAEMNEWVELLTNEQSGLAAVGLEPVDNANCGTGAGGFKTGNTCAKGGGTKSNPTGDVKSKAILSLIGGRKEAERVVQQLPQIGLEGRLAEKGMSGPPGIYWIHVTGPKEQIESISSILMKRNLLQYDPVIEEDLADNAFCATGKGGGIDNSCPPRRKGSAASIGSELVTPPPPGSYLHASIHRDTNGDGITDQARVGVPASEVPPPPPVPQLPNLTPHERAVEDSFRKQYEADPEGVAGKFRQARLEIAAKKGEPPTFGTDDAKEMSVDWMADPPARGQNRATLNLALHQTANAMAKKAAVQHMDTLQPGDEIMVTVGGCASGKGFALKANDEVKAMKNNSKMIWDSAGDQNATENTWLLEEAQRRGLKVTYVHVNADPKQRWADPQIGAVSRANDPLDGRMVDAKVYADSYAIGNANHQAFYEQHRNNPNVNFVFMDAAVPNPKFDKSKPADLKTNPQYLAPQRRDTMPESALGYNARELAAFALKTVRSRKDIPPHIARGATMGSRIWKGERPTANELGYEEELEWWELL